MSEKTVVILYDWVEQGDGSVLMPVQEGTWDKGVLPCQNDAVYVEVNGEIKRAVVRERRFKAHQTEIIVDIDWEY